MRKATGELLAGEAEHDRTHVVDLAGFREADLPDEHPLVGENRDEPGPLEGTRRLAHRAAADAEAGRQDLLVETLARLDLAVDDHPLELLRHDRGQRLRPAELDGGEGMRAVHGATFP